MKYSSISLFLNFIFIFIMIFGIAYFNKNEKRQKERYLNLKSQYIAKKDIKFNNLAKKEQENYLYIGVKDRQLAKFGLDEQNSTQKYIEELKNKLIIVQKDNLNLSNDKDKITKKITDMKKKLIEQKESLLSQNLKQINDIEQQNYRNISKLRVRIDDLQKENIDLLQDNNEEILFLQNKIKALRLKLESR